MRSPFFMPVPSKIQCSGFDDDPVAAAVDRLDVAGAHQAALVGPVLGERAVLLLAAAARSRCRRRRDRRGT